MDTEEIFNGLNTQQAAAVRQTDGPMLIIAGAGSGKTKVLTCRVAHLLNQGIAPWRILAITFTNKAAREMRDRVDRMSGYAAKDVALFTFHSFCARLLRREIGVLEGYSNNFVIYDTTDQKALLKQILKDFNLDDKRFPVNKILGDISNAKNAMQGPEEYTKAMTADGGFFEAQTGQVYAEYQKRLRNNNALDFDDLLLITVELFVNHPEVLAKYQERYLYIMVDEYQDTNRVQYLLTKLLADKYRNLCVVGDADQSIYGWRGADIRNILDFKKDYPEAVQIKLEQNYRSTQNILDGANGVIANNTERAKKELWTDKGAGTPILHYEADNALDEAYFVTEQIRNLTAKGIKAGDMAILYRANAQSRVLEEMLIKRGMQYTIVGGTRFYERKEIKDAIAYLHVLTNPYDSLNLLRIINVPKRGIGTTTISKLEEYARSQDLHLFDVLSNTESIPGLSAGTRKKLENFAELIFNLVAEKNNVPVKNLLEAVLGETGMLAELEESADPQEQARADNLKEFLSVAEDFTASGEENTLDNFLEHISLVSDIDTATMQEDAVTLMTLHSAKGLEFRVVFMVGMEDGTFPVGTTLMNPTELEEERRLCYVGMTRAREILYLINARERMLYGHTQCYLPSKFLGEIPKNLLQDIKKKVLEAKPKNLAAPKTFQRPGGITNTPEWSKKILGNFLPKDNNAGLHFEPGDRVTHAKFGPGTILEAHQEPDCQELIISFDQAGEKTLLTKYAKLTKQ